MMGDVDRIRAKRVLARLRAIASELSGCDVADLNEASTFFELGFDSLFLAQLTSAFQLEYGVNITFRQLFDEFPTLRAVGEHIDRQLPVEEPLSPGVDTVAVELPSPTLERPAEPIEEVGAPPPSTFVPVTTYEAVQRVIAQQLVVMTEQLQLLRTARRAGATASALAGTPAPRIAQVSPTTSVDAIADMPTSPRPIPNAAAEPALEPGPGSHTRRRIPLTPGQREIWIASQMGDEANCAFNESVSVLIEGSIDSARFAQAVTTVLAQQESFSYRFDCEGESQCVDAQTTFELPTIDLSELDEAARSTRLDAMIDREARTPFDLEKGPLVRGWLAKQGAKSHLLVIYCHHIVFDGYSSEIVMRRIVDAYSTIVKRPGVELAAGAVPFSAYANLAEQRRNDALAASTDYWRDAFEGDPPASLELPTDRPRDSRRTYRAGTVQRRLDATLSDGIRNTARTLGTSVFVLLLSAFQAMVSRLSIQEDIVIGVPMAGQARLGLEAVGYCVNALPVRATPGYARPFNELVIETRRKLLDAFDHQELSLGEIVGALSLPRDASRLPLVEVFFNYSGYSSGLSIDGCKLSTRENPRRAIYYDMFLCVTESDGLLAIDWRYRSDLFDEATIGRWAEHYSELLKGVVADSHQAIGDLPLLSRDQSAEIAAMWGR